MTAGTNPAPVYLDYNATAPVRPEAKAAMLAALDAPGNPSSVHRFGRAARAMAERARAAVAALIGGEAKRVIFTSGGTEANNLALKLFRSHAAPKTGGASLILSAIEHDSVLRPGRHMDIPVIELSAGRDGVVSLQALEKALIAAPKPALVALMLANNETGAIQPVAEATGLAHDHGALLLCDAVQAAGKIPVDMAALGCDFLSLSAHKLGGPTGVGALVTRDDWIPAPLLRGGGQELGQRAGTENLPGIAGFGAAAEAARQTLPEMAARIAVLRDRLQATLLAACPDVPVYGKDVPRLPNTLCIGMPGVPSEIQVMALDLAGIAVSAGSACSSGKVTPSHVLTGMGFPEQAAREAIRCSLGWATTADDIDRAAAAWTALWERKKK